MSGGNMNTLGWIGRFTLLFVVFAVAATTFKSFELQGKDECAFKTGYEAVGRGDAGRAKFNGHCEQNCIKAMHISGPDPIEVRVNETLSASFFTDGALGGPNDRCASSGAVNWGDGPNEPMPNEKITAGCGVGHTKIAGSDVPSVTMTHAYTKPGRYCLSASMFGNHKYDGDGSCSYDCVVRADKVVIVH
jgi:hypothetical protein